MFIKLKFRHNSAQVNYTIPFTMETKCRLQGRIRVFTTRNYCCITRHIARNEARHASWSCSVLFVFPSKNEHLVVVLT